MEEMSNRPNPAPWTGYPQPPVKPSFGTGRREMRLFAVIAVISVLMADVTLYGGLNLGFALTAATGIVVTAGYLLHSGARLSGYSGSLLALSLLICGSFARSNDGFMKFVMLLFLLISANLGLCLLAGQNRRDPGGIGSLLDAPRALFSLGIGRMGEAMRGLNLARKELGTSGRNRTAVLTGVAVAVPVVAILISLLVSADAAFEGMLALVPRIDLMEPVLSLIIGGGLACVLYARGVALVREGKAPVPKKERRGVNPLTVNTVLIAVCAVYLVYLVSQLAYFSGGFSGILPEAYTMAEYARRGFFEMAWLCAMDLGLMTAAVALAKPQSGRAPRSTRVLCLLIGLVTLIFVTTASAKMWMYIGAYGMTRLRVLTEVIMIFLVLTTAMVSIWLFVPKLAYMKGILLAGLLLGGAVAWMDVDTAVAAYNVHAYQTGALESVDVAYLASLSNGAVPYLAELTEAADPQIARQARQCLENRSNDCTDIRAWTIAGALADRH